MSIQYNKSGKFLPTQHSLTLSGSWEKINRNALSIHTVSLMYVFAALYIGEHSECKGHMIVWFLRNGVQVDGVVKCQAALEAGKQSGKVNIGINDAEVLQLLLNVNQRCSTSQGEYWHMDKKQVQLARTCQFNQLIMLWSGWIDVILSDVEGRFSIIQCCLL